MRGTILLCGIHGVGKTTAADKLTQRFSIPNFTASKIIKAAKHSSVSSDSKKVKDIDDNQKLLLNGIAQLLNLNDVIILDGHLTLLDSNFNIERIKLSVFKDLSLIGVLLLIDQPLEIYKRILIRDANVLPLHLIEKYQTAEQEYAKVVTKKLQIPLKVLNAYKENELFISFEDLIN